MSSNIDDTSVDEDVTAAAQENLEKLNFNPCLGVESKLNWLEMRVRSLEMQLLKNDKNNLT